MTWAIETFSLTKYFPATVGCCGWFTTPNESPAAVDQISVAVKSGEIFGLLGPNGAGKTTLIKMLSTLIIPTSGTASVNGYDLVEAEAVRSAITLVSSDERSFFWRLSGRLNLEFFAVLHQLPSNRLRSRVMEVLRLVGLEAAAEVPVRDFSTGMKQRLAIGRGLLTPKPILFLDEPTRGLDPTATRGLHKLIREELVGRQGITVVLATHQLWEAEVLCHRVAVMHQGRLQGCGSLSELRNDLGLTGRWCLVMRNLTPRLARNLEELSPPLGLTSQEGGDFLIEWEVNDDLNADDVIRIILQGEGKILHFSQKQASTEVIFDTLTKKPGPRICRSQEAGPTGERQEAGGLSNRRGDGTSLKTKFKEMAKVSLNWPRVAAAFIKRDFLEQWSYRLEFSLRLLTIFFSATVFYFMAQLFGQTVNPYLAPYGADYFSFVLVGIGFSYFFDVGLNTFSRNLREAQTTGTLEAMLTTPTKISLLIISSSLWSFLFASLQVSFYLGVGKAFFKANLGDFSIPVLLIILALTIVCFSSVGIIAASFIMVYKRGDPVIWLLSATSSLLSGIYYPVAILPGWLKSLAYCLPNTYVLEAVRKVFLQDATFFAIRQELAIISAFCLILMPLSLMVFGWAVHRAKIEGSLTHY